MVKFKHYSASSWIALFLCTGFFSGFMPAWIHPSMKGKGGGLMGSLVALVPLYFLWNEKWCTNLVFVLVTCGLTFPPLSTWIVSEGEKMIFSIGGPRRRHTGEIVDCDFNQTNYDEIVGMFWAAMCFWPMRDQHSVDLLIWAFLIFRALDTFKPYPISYIEKVWAQSNPAFSVIIDDVAAGIGAGASVAIVVFLST